MNVITVTDVSDFSQKHVHYMSSNYMRTPFSSWLKALKLKELLLEIV